MPDVGLPSKRGLRSVPIEYMVSRMAVRHLQAFDGIPRYHADGGSNGQLPLVPHYYAQYLRSIYSLEDN
jgi:hypothetical protein